MTNQPEANDYDDLQEVLKYWAPITPAKAKQWTAAPDDELLDFLLTLPEPV